MAELLLHKEGIVITQMWINAGKNENKNRLANDMKDAK